MPILNKMKVSENHCFFYMMNKFLNKQIGLCDNSLDDMSRHKNNILLDQKNDFLPFHTGVFKSVYWWGVSSKWEQT